MEVADFEKPSDEAISETTNSLQILFLLYRPGQNIIGVGGRVIYHPEDEPLFPKMGLESENQTHQDLRCLSGIGLAAVFNCILNICPAIADNGVVVNIDYKMVFLEFLELLLICAKLNVTKCIEDAKKEDSPKTSLSKTSLSKASVSKASVSKELASSQVKVDSHREKKKTSGEVKPKNGKQLQKKKKS